MFVADGVAAIAEAVETVMPLQVDTRTIDKSYIPVQMIPPAHCHLLPLLHLLHCCHHHYHHCCHLLAAVVEEVVVVVVELVAEQAELVDVEEERRK